MQESKKLTEKFHIIQQISRGDHSIIYSGIDRIDGNMLAIKAEPIKIKDSRLRHEYKVYRSLAVALGLPKIYYYKETSKYRLMFMELLGLNLEELFNKCNRRFSLVTTLRLSIQIISRLESIHEQSFILRNVAPSNFCIGLDVRREIIYCTNFSLAKKFRDLDAGINHIPMTSKKRKLHISPLFSSINCMMGSGQSRKDDIESLGYMMIYFVKGGLPWENLNQHDLILQKKQNISMERLADGLPKGIKIFMKNIKSLTFESRPEYDYLRLLLLDTLSALENNNCPPDWASMIVDRDKVNIGPHGIILKSAQSNNNNLNVIKPRRPSTAIQRTSNNINQSQRQRQRPSTAISRPSIFLNNEVNVNTNDDNNNNNYNHNSNKTDNNNSNNNVKEDTMTSSSYFKTVSTESELFANSYINSNIDIFPLEKDVIQSSQASDILMDMLIHDAGSGLTKILLGKRDTKFL